MALIKILLDYGANIQMVHQTINGLPANALEPYNAILYCFIMGNLYFNKQPVCNLLTLMLLLNKGAEIRNTDLQIVCKLMKIQEHQELKLKFHDVLSTLLLWHAGFNVDISCLKDIENINLENCVLIGTTIDGLPVTRETKNPDCRKAITDYDELQFAISNMSNPEFLQFYRKMSRSMNKDLKELAKRTLLLHPNSLQYQASMTLFSSSQYLRAQIAVRGNNSVKTLCADLFSTIKSIENEKPGYDYIYRTAKSPHR